MILIDPTTGAQLETFTDEATRNLIERGYYQIAEPDPNEKPKPKRTRRTKKAETKD